MPVTVPIGLVCQRGRLGQRNCLPGLRDVSVLYRLTFGTCLLEDALYKSVEDVLYERLVGWRLDVAVGRSILGSTLARINSVADFPLHC